MIKKVDFDLSKNIVYTTYSGDEYDRYCIDSVMYKRCYNKITELELIQIFIELDLYKLYEMKIHSNSYYNNSYSYRKILKKSIRL